VNSVRFGVAAGWSTSS